MDTDKLIPATVVEFDRAQNLATVRPLIMTIDMADNTRMRNALAQVPVFSLGGEGFHISFPLKQGDLGWIMAADRDISLFMQNLGAAPPNTLRKHSFSDSWFIPDVFRKYTINAEDSAAMVIQSTDGTTRISIGDGNVTITAPGEVTVDTPQANFTKNVQVGGDLQVIGNTQVDGGLDASGSSRAEVTLPADATIGGITVAGHGH
jgi:hypothetical protein